VTGERERPFAWAISLAVAACVSTACGRANGTAPLGSGSVTLRVGVPVQATGPTNGLRQIAQNMAIESLAFLSNDGRPHPLLAKDWQVSADGLALTVSLRSGVAFHDGTPVTSAIVAASVRQALASVMGPAFNDVQDVTAPNDSQVVVRLRQRSPFLLEALEVPVSKPGAPLTGTGPFIVSDPASPTELRANRQYYLGAPSVDRILFQSFPTVRSAWAELLRDQVDMLYEVSVDSLDSLEAATNVATFTSPLHYQYAVILNSDSPALRSKEVRRALNMAVDRDALVRSVLRGHGTASSGPVWPHNFASRDDWPTLKYNPQEAAKSIAQATKGGGRLHFTCLVRPNDVEERLALLLKQQLDAVGIDMSIQETAMDRALDALRHRTFDALLGQSPNGPTLLRSYRSWHSGGIMNADSLTIDTALDQIRNAASEDDYKKAVSSFQQAAVDDPPAIFLAWIERTRVVSKRFVVPKGDTGRDILSTLRLWKPATDQRVANRN
jgi:peptide/nickel transport system substrate-binding protein